MEYDSKKDTLAHIDQVNFLINLIVEQFIEQLTNRGEQHDASKLFYPEKEGFDEFTPKLKNCTYGSEEYKGYLKKLSVFLEHHYANNPHHPEHYEDGINGMDLIDIIEMFCDWKAASERHADGDIIRSIQINKERFNMSDQLVEIFNNTIKRFFSNKEIK